LNKYLDPKKPVFFYMSQGELEIQRGKESWALASNSALDFPRAANNLTIKNSSGVQAILLAVQP
jgi:hypothetical protein